MHHYQHHIGDYAAHAGHLSPIEDIAYRRMLDLYYLHERPFNGCSTDVARMIRMREHLAEVEAVLAEFFVQRDDGCWVQKRAEEEIAQYQQRRESAVKAGKASAKSRGAAKDSEPAAVQRPFNDRSTTAEQPSNQPVTVNREPLTKNQVERAVRAAPLVRPDDVSEQVWQDWKAHRKAKRATVNQTVLAKLRRDAGAAGMTLEEAMAYTVAQGHQGFFPPAGKAGGTVAPRLVAMSTQHIPNMPLGAASCQCQGCVDFRAKRAAP